MKTSIFDQKLQNFQHFNFNMMDLHIFLNKINIICNFCIYSWIVFHCTPVPKGNNSNEHITSIQFNDSRSTTITRVRTIFIFGCLSDNFLQQISSFYTKKSINISDFQGLLCKIGPAKLFISNDELHIIIKRSNLERFVREAFKSTLEFRHY